HGIDGHGIRQANPPTKVEQFAIMREWRGQAQGPPRNAAPFLPPSGRVRLAARPGSRSSAGRIQSELGEHRMNNERGIAGRGFARAAGAAGLAVRAIMSARALGREDKAAASERITLGFIGMGTMNGYHLGSFLKRPDVQVLAVCDCDTNRRE